MEKMKGEGRAGVGIKKKSVGGQVGESYLAHWTMRENSVEQGEKGEVISPFAYRDHVESLFFIERYVDKVLKTNSSPFAISVNKNGVRTFKANHLGAAGFDLLSKIFQISFIREILPSYRFCPNVELFYSELEKIGVLFEHPGFVGKDGRLQAEVFNDFADRLRKESRFEPYRLEVKRRKERANENHRSVVQYVNGLFYRYARLVVVRVDLAYKTDVKRFLDMKTVLGHREKLLNAIRKNDELNGKYVGYVMSLEWGRAKGGYHFHCFFFFDGSKSRQDISLGDFVGNVWVKEVTEGLGCYYNCNRNKHVYKSVGIGVVGHGDTELRANLIEAAKYVTKKEMFFAVLPDTSVSGKFRTFFRSEIKSKKSTSGRRRSEPDSNSQSELVLP
jgi:hypothetical protein